MELIHHFILFLFHFNFPSNILFNIDSGSQYLNEYLEEIKLKIKVRRGAEGRSPAAPKSHGVSIIATFIRAFILLKILGYDLA
jgi:hypothetical protein